MGFMRPSSSSMRPRRPLPSLRPVLAELVRTVETRTPDLFAPEDLPPGWPLNTCLVNLYGTRDGVDTARVGEHRDFEPGPVASISLGERALFQFVSSSRPGTRD